MRWIQQLIGGLATLVFDWCLAAAFLVGLLLLIVETSGTAISGLEPVVERQLSAIVKPGDVIVESAALHFSKQGLGLKMALRYVPSPDHGILAGQVMSLPDVRADLSLRDLANGRVRLRTLTIAGPRLELSPDSLAMILVPYWLPGLEIAPESTVTSEVEKPTVPGPRVKTEIDPAIPGTSLSDDDVSGPDTGAVPAVRAGSGVEEETRASLDASVIAGPGDWIDRLLSPASVAHLESVDVSNMHIVIDGGSDKSKHYLLPQSRLVREGDQISMSISSESRLPGSDLPVKSTFEIHRDPTGGTTDFLLSIDPGADGRAKGTGERIERTTLGVTPALVLPFEFSIVVHDRTADSVDYQVIRGQGNEEVSVNSGPTKHPEVLEARRRSSHPIDVKVVAGPNGVEATGELTIASRSDSGPLFMAVGLSTNDVRLELPWKPGAPVLIENGGVDLILRPATGELEFPGVWVSDGAGIARISGWLGIGSDGQPGLSDWNGHLDINIDRIGVNRLLEFWPPATSTKSRTWLEQQVRSGGFHDVSGWIDLGADAPAYEFEFGFDGAAFQVLAGLPPVKDASGSGRMTMRTLDVRLETGRLEGPTPGAFELGGTRFKFDQETIDSHKNIGVLSVSAVGSADFLLHLLETVPLGELRAWMIDPTAVSGRVELTGNIRFPLETDAGLDTPVYEIKARFDDLVTRFPSLPGVGNGESIDLTAESLVGVLDSTELALTGTVSYGEFPAELEWRIERNGQQLRGNRLVADFELSNRLMTALSPGWTANILDGDSPARLDVDFAHTDGRMVTLTSRLQGSTLSVPVLGWVKPSPDSAQLVATFNLDRPDEPVRLRFTSQGLKFECDLVFANGEIASPIAVRNLEVGGWLSTSAALHHETGSFGTVALEGGTFDISAAPVQELRSGEAYPLSITLDRMIVSNRLSLTGFRGNFGTGGVWGGTFSGMLNGTSSISGAVRAIEGRSVVEVTASDGGDVMRSADIFRSAYGGDLLVRVFPDRTGEFRDIRFRLKNIRVRDSPVLAEILNAISVVGLLQQITGSGIQFDVVDGRLEILPEGVRVSNMRAVGASMNLSLEGWYDPEAETVDFSGVVAPIYTLTGVLDQSIRAIFGGLFTGGKRESIFGFNYRMVGPAENPTISVDPLSVLTPGFFREIFGRDFPEPPQKQQ